MKLRILLNYNVLFITLLRLSLSFQLYIRMRIYVQSQFNGQTDSSRISATAGEEHVPEYHDVLIIIRYALAAVLLCYCAKAADAV